MSEASFRVERDSLGEVRVPKEALYGAQTQRAVEIFPLSGWRFPRSFIRALGMIKEGAAIVNQDLGFLDSGMAAAIRQAAQEVAEGKHDDQFPLDIFQTGSGTSTHMNANEVIATLATRHWGRPVHPNDHVNMSQSSNDVIPTAIHVSAASELMEQLLPALQHLKQTIHDKAATVEHVVKNGRTHLMDALPIRMSQELRGWNGQIAQAQDRIQASFPRLLSLAIGGTAVGTGINAHPEFGRRVAEYLSSKTALGFVASSNPFEQISSQDAAVEISAQLKGIAVSLTKIANDLRWMNSGPHSGLAEIVLPILAPGSSIMPGKVNPVIPEAVLMACAQIIGQDLIVTLAGGAGNFQLNTMLPIVAYNLLCSIRLLANSTRLLADRAIRDFVVNEARIAEGVCRNPVLVTALNPMIGYEKAAAIAKRAAAEGRPVKDVAAEMTSLKREDLERLLDPKTLTQGGISPSPNTS